ncbi:response regulator [Myxococcaceae bacterium GXIMD 01537]
MRGSPTPPLAEVLVVDDEPVLRTVLGRAVEPLGARVHVAGDGAEARRLIAQRAFACALIDKNLPGESGLAFLRWLRAAQPDCNALIVTGFGNMDSAVEALRAGAFDYMTKPFDLLALQHRVRLALEQHRMRTEQMRLQALLVQADRLASLGTLAAGVVHEVNNPLAYVLSNLESVREQLPALRAPIEERTELRGAELAALGRKLAAIDELLKDVHEGTERMRLLVRDVKAFAHGAVEDVGLIDLRPVLEAALKMASVHLRHRAHVERDYGPVPPVRASGPRMAQVFLNLLLNAGHALEGARGEPRVRVRLRTGPSGQAEAEVTDSGQGINPEHLPRLFEPYFTTRPPGEGTGLGLFICRSLVESFGGRIQVESEPGLGTTFRITLPSCAEDAPVAPQSASRNTRTGPEPSPAVR